MRQLQSTRPLASYSRDFLTNRLFCLPNIDFRIRVAVAESRDRELITITSSSIPTILEQYTHIINNILSIYTLFLAV